MMPVCCPAVGSPGAYSKHTIARWGLLYWDISRSLARLRLTAVRKDWDWCGLLASLDWIPNLWRYSDVIQKQRSDSSRHPLPHPPRDVLAASRWSCTIEKRWDCTTAPGKIGSTDLCMMRYEDRSPDESGNMVCSRTRTAGVCRVQWHFQIFNTS